MSKNQWVTPRHGKWAVRAEKSEKDTKLFEHKNDAVKYGRELAKKQESQLIVQKVDGKIQHRYNYMGK